MMCTAGADSPFHVGIATTQVDELQTTFNLMLGLRWRSLPRPPIVHQTPRGPVAPSSRVVWSRQGPLHVELIHSEAGTVYDPARGTHLHHVGFWAEDFGAELRRRRADGWTIEVTIHDEHGQPTSFAYLSRPGDIWIEVIDIANRPGLDALLSAED